MISSELRVSSLRPLAPFALAVAAILFPTPKTAAQGIHDEYEGLTRPSKDVDLVLRVPGVLAEMPVTPGQRVKTGDLIAALKSDLEEASLEIARLKAESDHHIRVADVNKKFKETELKRLQELGQTQAASRYELDEALVEVELAEVESEATRFEKQLLIHEFERAQLVLAERRLLAPFDGVILRTLKEVGEGVDELEPIAILVKLDPVWVECNLPAVLFGEITVGQPAGAQVAGRSRAGKVVAVDPLVDAASDTFRVIVEVPNADGAIVGGVTATALFAPTSARSGQP
ncbi:MAG: efflux RND transporter periplasmic adaptor subunit [Planctomycetota bacterium]